MRWYTIFYPANRTWEPNTVPCRIHLTTINNPPVNPGERTIALPVWLKSWNHRTLFLPVGVGRLIHRRSFGIIPRMGVIPPITFLSWIHSIRPGRRLRRLYPE